VTVGAGRFNRIDRSIPGCTARYHGMLPIRTGWFSNVRLAGQDGAVSTAYARLVGRLVTDSNQRKRFGVSSPIRSLHALATMKAHWAVISATV
jgi:hypothetical protein